MEKDLRKANTPEERMLRPWVATMIHRPVFADRRKILGRTADRSGIKEMIEKYEVDLVLSGHCHNYERLYPYKFQAEEVTHREEGRASDPYINMAYDKDYSDDPSERDGRLGTIQLIIGTGGHGTSAPCKRQSGLTVGDTMKVFGFGHFEADRRQLLFQMIDDNGRVLDEFKMCSRPRCANPPNLPGAPPPPKVWWVKPPPAPSAPPAPKVWWVKPEKKQASGSRKAGNTSNTWTAAAVGGQNLSPKRPQQEENLTKRQSLDIEDGRASKDNKFRNDTTTVRPPPSSQAIVEMPKGNSWTSTIPDNNQAGKNQTVLSGGLSQPNSRSAVPVQFGTAAEPAASSLKDDAPASLTESGQKGYGYDLGTIRSIAAESDPAHQGPQQDTGTGNALVIILCTVGGLGLLTGLATLGYGIKAGWFHPSKKKEDLACPSDREAARGKEKAETEPEGW